MKIALLLSFIFSFLLASDNTYLSCSQAKSEFYRLDTEKTEGYKNDSMQLDLVTKDKKMYVKNGSTETELFYIGNSQFLEPIASGHNALYTIHEQRKLVTVQKSYNFLGTPVMVTTYLKCK